MPTFTLPILEAEFSDAGSTPAQGADVYAQDAAIASFLNGGTMDSTNISMSATYPWTGPHSHTVSSAGTDNFSVIVGAVMSAAKYGVKISTTQAQTNSALCYLVGSSGSQTTPLLEQSYAGSGSSTKITSSATATCVEAINSSTSNTNATYQSTQAGTGAAYGATLRTLSGLNSVLCMKVLGTPNSVSNDTTETVADLTVTLPANFLQVGTTIRGKVYGLITTPGAGPATAALKVKYGGTGGTLLLSSGAVTPTINLTNSPVALDFMITCISIGATGTVEAQGLAHMNPSAAISSTIGPASRGMGTAGSGLGNTAVITIDTTVSSNLVVTFTWGTAVAGCTFNFRSGYIELVK